MQKDLTKRLPRGWRLHVQDNMKKKYGITVSGQLLTNILRRGTRNVGLMEKIVAEVKLYKAQRTRIVQLRDSMFEPEKNLTKNVQNSFNQDRAQIGQ